MEDSAYIYAPGWGFFPVAYSGQVTSSPRATYTESFSATGGRSINFRPAASRSWHVAGDVPIDWAQDLLKFRSGMFGHGPFWWVSPLAQRTNALPYGFEGITRRAEDADGAVVAVTTADEHVSGATPVKAGMEITSSAWLTTGTLAVRFYGVDGGLLLEQSANIAGPALSRSSITSTAPEGSVWSRVAVTGVRVDAGQPAITWGPSMRFYLPPEGCPAAYLDVKDFSHQLFAAEFGDSELAVAFSVLEVGSAAS